MNQQPSFLEQPKPVNLIAELHKPIPNCVKQPPHCAKRPPSVKQPPPLHETTQIASINHVPYHINAFLDSKAEAGTPTP